MNDISIDSNDELNKILLQLQDIPIIFSTTSLSEDYLTKTFKEVRRLRELKSLFSLGLRDICDQVLNEKISNFSYEEIERIIEARFEATQLRDSLLRTIFKALKN